MRRLTDPAVHSCVTQPRHLALLCYLTLARPRGLHERDTLVAMLWPDHNELRGRRALRNALHGLRLQLGAHAIISAGEHLVGVDPAFVSCDAVELESGALSADAALDGTDWDAVDGAPEPFQGLHVRRSAEFDQWLSAERDRLRALLVRHSSPRAPSPVRVSTPPRRPHAADASTMYARGHYLFLRTAHGGPAAELLLSRDYFERAFALDPTFAPALAGLANFYAVAARRGVLAPFHETFGEAIALSERVLDMDDTLAVPHVHFGVRALFIDDDWERASTEFDLAVAKEPEYAEGRRFRAVWLGMSGRLDEALSEAESAATLEPDIPHMLSSLAAARLAAGDRAGAEAALHRTLEVEPRHAPARGRLVRVLEEDGRFDEAVAERVRAPAMRDADAFRRAFAEDGSAGYQRVLRETLAAEAAALEARALTKRPTAPDEIFSPPIVRLVALYARLGDWKRVKSWQLVGTAARPALAHWFEAIPELRRG
jgi:DNA-binding SARP family transcriptional activator